MAGTSEESTERPARPGQGGASTPLPEPRRVNCNSQHTLFLKANGDLPCEDDVGEQVLMGRVEPDRPFDIETVLQGPRYRHIRAAMARGEQPWPLVCQRCAFLRPGEPHRSAHLAGRIEKIQVETTLACALRCPGCNGFSQIAERPGPHMLPLDSFRRLLVSCAERGYRIGTIEFCGQGEPLAHKQFQSFLDLSRELHTQTRQRLITNGNYDFDSRIPGRLPDEIYVSCDGLWQSSYEQYRIGGKVTQVLRFMEDAVARARAQSVRRSVVIWKYVLFDHNDSDAELVAAQETAERIGVDRLLFVATHSRGRSRRFPVRRLSELPIVSDVAMANSVPLLERDDAETVDGSDAAADFSFLHIDEAELSAGTLVVRGWAIGEFGRLASEIEVWQGGRRLGRAQLRRRRDDVAAHLTHWPAQESGFEAIVPVPPGPGDRVILRARIGRSTVERALALPAATTVAILPPEPPRLARAG